MIKYETDSRKIKKGQIFVAIKGHTVDGHDYINKAIENGAESVVAEHEVQCTVPVKVVESTEVYLKERLKEEYAEKLNNLRIIGLTGTNGKTTTCYLIYQLLRLFKVPVAYMGTIGFKFGEDNIVLENTTPDTLTIYKLLLDAYEKGCTTVVMEVSSHSLSLERPYGLKLDIAGFTNLTEDHLDYHKTMEAYLNEKLKIINYLKKDGKLIVNSDDEASKNFIEKFGSGLTVGINGDLKIKKYEFTPANTTIDFSLKGEDYKVVTNLTSKFNVYNYLTALGVLSLMGYKVEDIISLSKDVYPPKGRCETHEVNGAYAIIDYAHTPDAVEKVISAYNELKTKRLITIIGCGGDRDPLKRPLMGDIATNLSDYTILTNDNPRTEDPNKIMKDILKGISSNNYEVVMDRHEAINKGLDMLQKDDILMILGKGHEDYQIIGHEKIYFDDAKEVEKWKEKHIKNA